METLPFTGLQFGSIIAGTPVIDFARYSLVWRSLHFSVVVQPIPCALYIAIPKYCLEPPVALFMSTHLSCMSTSGSFIMFRFDNPSSILNSREFTLDISAAVALARFVLPTSTASFSSSDDFLYEKTVIDALARNMTASNAVFILPFNPNIF